MMKTIPRKVRCSSMTATYDAGIFCTDNDAAAVEQAREKYAESSLGRALRDVGAFRFYVVARGAECYA
jgi:hypothetical protein